MKLTDVCFSFKREGKYDKTKLTDVCFSYGDKSVIDHLTVEFPDTGITALSGPSGCGKTTLLRLIAGLERPQSGAIDAPAPNEIAILFQENRLFRGFTAAEQITSVLPDKISPLPWLHAVGLEGEENAYPAEFSGGMQRRLSLARCLAYGRDKKLFLLDEPFTGVDHKRVMELVALLRRMEIPVIFTTHDSEAIALADVTICLD